MAKRKVPVEVIGLNYSSIHSGAYALVLKEKGGNRRLPIIIGGLEAQAIAIKLENMTVPRPLTHDLLQMVVDSFGIRVTEVIIYDFRESTFHAKMICDDGLKVVELECRTSDAVAMALRFECPIYTYEFILSSAGIVMNDDDELQIETELESDDDDPIIELTKDQNRTDEFESMSNVELEKELQKAIGEEAYERASKIQREIDKRKNS
ncbi:MAG TPA: bifunctional nuclease family protein [Bacteroidia bacterium]